MSPAKLEVCMLNLQFSGYGGEFTIGKLSDKEINKIGKLLHRFSLELIYNNCYNVPFGEGREHFSDFNDAYSGWGPTDLYTVEDENGSISFQPSKIKDITFRPIEITKSGYYLLSGSFEKGGFCTVEIDCESSEFEISKFGLIVDDLSDTWLNVSLITGATYYGMDLELNYDSASTRGKSFNQIIMYYDIETEEWTEGVSGLEIVKPFECEEFDEMPFGDADAIFKAYMEIADEEKPLTQIELNDGILLYVSPLIEYMHGIDVCLEMWLSDSAHINAAKNHDLMHEVPQFVMEYILKNKPEWLV